MPFTFSHPALILPFTAIQKKWFSTTGLVVGSLIPDFEYFIRMKIESKYSHTFSGLFWFDIPLGLLVAFLYHSFVRNDLIKNSPKFIQSRLLIYTHFDWFSYFKKHVLVVIFSVLIGAATHLFWDSFTYDTGYFVSKIPILKASILWNGFQIPYLKLAQHGSSFTGILILLIAFLRLKPMDSIENYQINWKYWKLFFGIVILIVSVRFGFTFHHFAIGNVVVSVISGVIIALTTVPKLLQFQFKSIFH